MLVSLRASLGPLFGLAFLVTTSSVALGCAGGGGGGPSGGDGGTRDGGGGADGAIDGGARDGGRRDSGMITCPTGEHACGGGCVDDQPNEPENGCRLGCGEACPTPPDGMASCNSAGTCDFACAPPFRREGDACVCSPTTCDDMGYECGSPDDGCGHTLNCGTCSGGGMCIMGVCGCTADPHESNDSNTTATRGIEVSDSDDPDLNFTDYTIDEATDVDWLVFHVLDGTDGGNPRLNVRLSGIPVGSDYDLAAYYVCDEGGELTACNLGTVDNGTIGHGCVSRNAGVAEETVELATDCDRTFSADDPGQFYIRVTAPTFGGSCAPYNLAIQVR